MRPRNQGFALLEVVIASAIVTTIAAGSYVVLSMSIQASQQARTRTIETIVGVRKMEQLRSLAWTHMSTSAPVISMSLSDVTTDVSNDPESDDGPGLLASPAGTLSANVDGYADYLDANGQWIGRGTSPPAAAVYIRRWAVRPHPRDPDNLLILEVVVGTRGASSLLLPNPIHLVTLEARK